MSGDGMFLPWEGSNLPTGAIGESSSWFSSSGIGLDPSDDFYSLPETHIFMMIGIRVSCLGWPVFRGHVSFQVMKSKLFFMHVHIREFCGI